jgi:translation initiation factor IF-2
MQNNETKKNSFYKRPPVVVILGHVDSGKTSLLDYIRKTSVAVKESGGITQRIGAYQVEIGNPSVSSGQRKITFLDTPGHEAFSAMRARGAKVADIAILVVDGVEGIQPQTKEAIAHIKSAGIPMIVAINKIDRPEAGAEKIKKQLMGEGIIVESLGGKIPSINVSAKSGKGVEELLEMILLVGEVENLNGTLDNPAEGVVVESYLDSKRGPITTLIISDGTLRAGDIVGTDSSFGKIKNLENFQGAFVERALPSDPVVAFGLPELLKVGETFKIFGDTEKAQSNVKVAEKKEIIKPLDVSDDKQFLNLILKIDFLGSLEAIQEVLKEIPQEKVALNILSAGVGDVNESDVKLARSSGAMIFSFRVKINPVAKQLAERDKIRIMNFEVIYDLVEGVRKAMERILFPENVRTDIGRMKVLAIFMVDKNRQVIGGRVFFGEIKKGAQLEVERNEEVIGKGKMINLQKNKKDADRVVRGEECGILFEGDIKIDTGDVLTAYVEEKKKGEL